MLTSLSCGRSSVRPSYICKACLNSILGNADPRPLALGRKTFSSTAPDRGRGRRRGTASTSSPLRLVSNSKSSLAALREVLLAEEQKPSGEESKSPPKKSKPPREKSKPPREKSKPASETLEPSIQKSEIFNDKSKPPKKKIHKRSVSKKDPKNADTTERKASPEPAADATSTTPKSTRQKRAAKPKASKITEEKSKAKPPKPTPSARKVASKESKPLVNFKKSVAKRGANNRMWLVNVIQNGNLSPTERAQAIRTLRESLVSKIPTKVSPTHRDDMNIRNGMLKRTAPAPRRGPGRTPPLVKLGRATPNPVKTGPLKSKTGFEIQTIDANELELIPLDIPQPPVPKLSYGLERVLFNPGVYHLQDPRSRVFNFDPYLAKIMPVTEFDFNALKQYVTSSRDETLLTIARAEGKKYTGSTSSTTSALAHFHFLLSQWRPITTGSLSQSFPVPYTSFTGLQRGPSAVFLRWKDGVYAIDADKQYDNANILSMLGKSMEKLLTLPTEDFEMYRKENSDQISEEQRNELEAFNYTTIGDFLLRSQLDAHDPRLPGTGMFDLKTRAVISIRMDTKEYEQGMGYEIKGRHGEYESFDREYYDMIRAAFLKYSLQVRMGRMDGIFVAFHNTERIFGFQYISLSEMDYALHGTDDTTLGDSEFKLSLELLNRVLDKAAAKYPEKSLRLHFETRGDTTPFMYIFAEPMEEEEIQNIQDSNKAAIMEFEQSVLGIGEPKIEEQASEMASEERKNIEWQSLRAKVEESMEKDELSIQEAREFAETMLEEGGHLSELSAEEKEKLMDDFMEKFEEGDDSGD